MRFSHSPVFALCLFEDGPKYLVDSKVQIYYYNFHPVSLHQCLPCNDYLSWFKKKKNKTKQKGGPNPSTSLWAPLIKTVQWGYTSLSKNIWFMFFLLRIRTIWRKFLYYSMYSEWIILSCTQIDRKEYLKALSFLPLTTLSSFSDTSLHSGFLLPKRNLKNCDLCGVRFLFQSVNTLLLLIFSSLWQPLALFVS